MAENLLKALQMATTNTQSALLPAFWNDPKDDQSEATERLQKWWTKNK
jgi:hypothetical protein